MFSRVQVLDRDSAGQGHVEIGPNGIAGFRSLLAAVGLQRFRQPYLQPYLLSLSSGHLTVGGVVHFTMNLASVLSDLRVNSVTAHIIQSYIFYSHAKPGMTGRPPPHRRQLFSLYSRTPLQRPGTPPSHTGTPCDSATASSR